MPDLVRTLRAADGVAVRYRLWRPEAPRRLLVLIHGLASNMTRWSEFVAQTSLKEAWDILRIDLRGYGGSVARGRVGLDVWCADLGDILRAEASGEVVVAGHCLGAHVAAEFTHRHPERVTGLILVEPMFSEALRGGLRRAAALRPVLTPVVWLTRALNALGVHRRRLPALDLEAFDRETRAALAAGVSESLLARYASPLEDLKYTPTAVYLQSLIAVSGGLRDLSPLRTPVLALVSSGGALSDPAITERQLAALPGCRIVRLSAQHWIPTERPHQMREAIEMWCRTLAAP